MKMWKMLLAAVTQMRQKRKTLRAVDPVSGWRLYYPNKPTTLYYVEFNVNGVLYYKIGITTKTVQQRFAGDNIPCRVLWKRTYASGRTAYIKEQKILQKYDKYRLNDIFILHSGNRELFSKNIMKGSTWTN